ncbi:MAG TPA: alpha/beta hydrolase-fold protein [Bacilli bacterium]|nr:alpha/beta hydrolase-fold protein [Bacilli bacterium]
MYQRGEKYKDLDIDAFDYKTTGHEYLNFIVNTVKPYVDSNYNTLTNKENTTIAGSSMGGLISLFGGLEHLDTFSNIISYSTTTGLVKDENDLIDYFNSKENLIKDTKFYFYIGDTKDGDINWPSKYKKYLINAGTKSFNIKTNIGKGRTHNEAAWREELEKTFIWLFNIT